MKKVISLVSYLAIAVSTMYLSVKLFELLIGMNRVWLQSIMGLAFILTVSLLYKVVRSVD